MTITVSLHGWDWVWLVLTVALAAFVWGFFSELSRDLLARGERRRH